MGGVREAGARLMMSCVGRMWGWNVVGVGLVGGMVGGMV